MPTDPAFTVKRECNERIILLAEAIDKNPKCVITGSLCGWGDIFVPKFQLYILIDTPTDIRIERLKKREYKRFGDRILPGGDMHEEHIEFLEWASKYDTGGVDMRSRAMHEAWLENLSCPGKRVDGTLPVDEIIKSVFFAEK